MHTGKDEDGGWKIEDGKEAFSHPPSSILAVSSPCPPCLRGESSSFPAKLRALAADIKIHHSVFALPWAVLAAVLAGSPGGLRWGQLGLIVICMVAARTVAMTANRLLDAEVDAQNPRTARRAIPSGTLSRSFVILSLVLCAILFVAATAGFWVWYRNPWPLALSVPVLLFLSAYPFLKRFSRFCHYYLGAALALAPVCAWIAIKGTLAAPPFYMFAAVLLWTAGFDIIYACQDYAFDVEHGLFSVPAKIGIGPALWTARLTHLACIGFIVLLGWRTPELGTLYWIGVVLAVLLIGIEHALVKPDDLSKVGLAFFTVNGIISLLLGTLGVMDILLH
jgi:4-hydroxybenzoate polyprenyltransferase